jgi:hypothetical protein
VNRKTLRISCTASRRFQTSLIVALITKNACRLSLKSLGKQKQIIILRMIITQVDTPIMIPLLKTVLKVLNIKRIKSVSFRLIQLGIRIHYI